MNSIEIVTEYPLWFSALCLFAGATYAGILYFRDKTFEESSMWLKRSMAAFRFLTVSIIAFLLLSPLIKRLTTTVEKPIIIVGQDVSSSLYYGADSGFYSGEYKEKMTSLIDELKGDYEVKTYSFGEEVRKGSEYEMKDKMTNISSFLEEVQNRFVNRNVGALIMASDGIYNRGRNPLYADAGFDFPLFTIALGDTSERKDLILRKVLHNRIAYLGNEFPLEAVINAKQCKGEKTAIKIYKDGKELFSKTISLNSNDHFSTETVLLKARETGMQKYRVVLTTVEGEVSKTNNAREVYIDILDSKKKVLLLASAPHPDLKAIQQSISQNKNYSVKTALMNEFKGSFSDYSLVILHQIPIKGSGQQQSLRLLKELKGSEASLLYVLGGQTPVNAFNSTGTGLQIKDSRMSMNDVFPFYNEQFSYFELSKSTAKLISDLPPLTCPFGKYFTNESFKSLFYQKIGMVETDDPLIMFSQAANKKKGIIAGEGLWRWRLSAYAQTGNHKAFNELMNKIVQYLSITVEKSRFRIVSSNSFYENEPLTFDAELYNESYELVNEPEVKLEITDEKGEKFPFVFSKTSKSYFLNAGMFPVGEYKYRAKVEVGDKTLTESGSISVKPLQIESVNIVADHQLLFKLSGKHNGQMYYPDDLSTLPDNIRNKEEITSVSYTESSYKPLVELKWIFFLILGLLTAEWFLRKRNGAY